jgi:phosphate transport system substrate-binding protein
MAIAANEPVTLRSAGSTFIYPIFAKWTAAYRRSRPDVQITYDPVGSGRGISRTLAGTVDFGASDGPIGDAQLQQSAKQVLHIPVVLGAVVPAYNLPGVKQPLHFTPAALAGIFLGTITRWDDPEMARANPGVQLPAREIAPVFRSDSSGTTYVWTDYLSKIDSEWKKRVGVGTTVGFPVGSGAQFNEGVLDFIKRRPYTIGYLQSSYAIEGHVQYGMVRNSSGNFIQADTASITAAAGAVEMPADFRVSIVNNPGAHAWPIASYSWLLVPTRIDDKAKAAATVSFLKWVLSNGQKLAAPLNFGPIPDSVAQRAFHAVEQIQ